MIHIEQSGPHPTERLELHEWQVQGLRLTAFPRLGIGFDHSAWWERVCRGLPDSEVREPKRNQYTAKGPFDGGELILRILPGRIDWSLQGLPSDSSDIPTVGSLPEFYDVFCELMSRWFDVEGLPLLTRLAFGAALLHWVADREAGYRQVQPYLSYVRLDPVGSSDFLYQINRPRDSASGIPGLRVNRLSKWSVMLLQSRMVRLGPDGGEVMSGPDTRYACRLELDINTAAGFPGAFERPQLRQVFGELVSLGREVILEGDIP